MHATAVDTRMLHTVRRGDAIMVTFPSNDGEDHLTDALRMKGLVEWHEVTLLVPDFLDNMLMASGIGSTVWPDDDDRTIVFIATSHFNSQRFAQYLGYAEKLKVTHVVPSRSTYFRAYEDQEAFAVGQRVYPCSPEGEPEEASVRIAAIRPLHNQCDCGAELVARKDGISDGASWHEEGCQTLERISAGHPQLLTLETKTGLRIVSGACVKDARIVSEERKLLRKPQQRPKMEPAPQVASSSELERLAATLNNRS